MYWDEGLFPGQGWVALFSRHRTKLGGSWHPTEDVSVRVVLANEFFSWYRHRDKPDFTLDEVFIDNLYARWAPASLPFTLTIGRQNMMFGEGFMIMDGGPLDGSRSINVNAVRADVRPAPGQTLSLFALRQPARDDMLPLIHDADRGLLETRTTGAGAYYTIGFDGAQLLDTYYIYTDEQPSNAWTQPGSRHSVGVRGVYTPAPSLRLTGEAVAQAGTVAPDGEASRDLLAWAGYAYATWLPTADSPLSLDAGLYHYSGGASGEAGALTDHGFAPTLARWPKWSESFIYTLVVLRGGVARWNDLVAPFLRARYRLSPALSLHMMLQHLREGEGASPWSTGDGALGTLAILGCTYDAGGDLTGHALLERMWFSESAAEAYIWSRLELRWRHGW